MAKEVSNGSRDASTMREARSKVRVRAKDLMMARKTVTMAETR